MKRIFLGVALLLVTACGDGQSDIKNKPVDELVKEAAAGDGAAMKELERRAAEKARAANKLAEASDPEAVFQKTLMSGDTSAVEELAKAGNPFAQTYIASLIAMDANASEDDKTRARKLLEAAAEAGHGPALFRISEDSLGPSELYPTDEAKALTYGIRAAEAGHAEAMYKTGIRYQYGLATAPQNNKKAIEWLTKAKAAGYRDAQRQLDELESA